jgi:hypothetical protein
MYGYDDLYNSPLVYRPHQRSRGPLLPSEHVIDQIADRAVDETSVEIYGTYGAFDFKSIGDWAKGIVDPAQRLKNWKKRLRRLANKWRGFDKRGDSQSDKIATRMLKLAAKIKGRQSDWEPPERIESILAKYSEGKAMGFTRKEKRKAKKAARKARKGQPEDIDELDDIESEDEAERTDGPSLEQMTSYAVSLAKTHESAGSDGERAEIEDELMSLIEAILEKSPDWDPPYSVAQAVEKFGAILGIPTNPAERLRRIQTKIELLEARGPTKKFLWWEHDAKRRMARLARLRAVRDKLQAKAGYGAIDLYGRNFDYPGATEGRMARSILRQLRDSAAELEEALQDDDDLPGWVNSKIATSADRMATVNRYMMDKIPQQPRFGAIDPFDGIGDAVATNLFG